MLNFVNVNQFYSQSHILHDITLEVKKGECTTLMGRNGEGKTTLLKVLMGLIPLRSGTITFEGTDITHLKPEQRVRLGIGYVPQGRQIFPLLTVEENLKTGLAARSDGLKHVPEFIYDFFPVLYDMGRRRGGDLSGGQQQQLAIGRALATNPKLLVLDEPTEGIQPNIVSDIAGIIRRLRMELNLSVLLVEQKVPFARKAGDIYVILERGSVKAQGRMSALDDATVKRYLSV